MKIKSLMMRSELFIPLELDIKLVPGLPKIEFLGLPETSLKESSQRIKAAIRSAGFDFPRGRQILVDVRPRGEKKHGRGLDLAVALGILAETKQIDAARFRDFSIYGDIGLNGEVMAPADWARARALVTGPLLTGSGVTAEEFKCPSESEGLWRVTTLKGLEKGSTEIEFLEPTIPEEEEPLVHDLELEPEPARLAVIAAVGGHSVMLAGPPGTGKSTLAHVIHDLSPRPTKEERREIEVWTGRPVRPLVQVHHTASEIAMVGGRTPPRPGAITRAHRGTLVMDEVLLFRPEVQESLREPMESGFIDLARGTDERRFPADFQLVGTTNLCECGRWAPGAELDCRCTSRVRARYEARLRGPFIDRFQMMMFSTKWSPAKGTVSTESMRADVVRAHAFAREQGRQAFNRRWKPVDIPANFFALLPKGGSERRRLAILRVARTIADLDASTAIQREHLTEAKEWCLDAFVQLSGPSS